jgi:hypothetical protein
MEPTRHLRVQPNMDDIEREAIRDEGYNPDDPAVVAALDRVRAELAALGRAIDRRLTVREAVELFA